MAIDVKFCSKCGASVPENANFCLSCGMNLSTINSQPVASFADTPSETQPRNIATGNITDLEVSAARMKSYIGIAIFVFVLYWIFFFPGLIVNYIYLQEAKKMQEKAGTNLPGVDLLNTMFLICSIITVISIVITALVLLYIFSGVFLR
jgi:uncharacterized membrane protein YvbJ